jgi:multiple sugar transport system permease protein
MMNMRVQRRLTNTISYTVLMIWSAILFFPIYWVIITSFKDIGDMSERPTFIPFVDFQPKLHAWHFLFVEELEWFLKPFGNSLIIASTTAISAVMIGSMAGYALARYNFRNLNNRIILGFMAQRLFPGALFILAFLVMFRELGLLDTRLALIIVYTGGTIPFVVWVMRDFFAGIPVEIEEAALIDGANRIGVLFRIAMPLAVPGLVAVFVLAFIGAWNEYLVALTLSFQNSVTIPLFIQQQVTQTGLTEWWNMSAIALVSLIPIFVITAALERYITGGLTFGAMKG